MKGNANVRLSVCQHTKRKTWQSGFNGTSSSSSSSSETTPSQMIEQAQSLISRKDYTMIKYKEIKHLINLSVSRVKSEESKIFERNPCN